MRVKDGDLLFQRIKFKDKLGNWYWKQVTRPSPIPIEIQDLRSNQRPFKEIQGEGRS